MTYYKIKVTDFIIFELYKYIKSYYHFNTIKIQYEIDLNVSSYLIISCLQYSSVVGIEGFILICIWKVEVEDFIQEEI